MSPLGGDYRSFLLRVWRLRRDGTSNWRLVLVSTASGQEWHFSSLDDLAGILSNSAWQTPDASWDETPAGSHSQA